MIAACPKCEARYRIEREKLGSEGVRLRCSKCQSVFRVRAPAPAAGPRSVAPAAPPPIPAAPEDVSAESLARPVNSLPSPPPVASPPPRSDSPLAGADAGLASAADSSAATPVAPAAKPGEDAPLVLVATPDENVAKMLRESLEAWGVRAATVSDGVEAMLEIQRQLPDVVLLAPTLPRMYGFQVCEIVKRNESLQGTGVILLGAIHHPDRYRRPPEELYGADAYVEEPDLPDALLPELRRLGIVLREAPAAVPEISEPAAGGEARSGDLPAPTAPASVEVPAAEPAPSAVPRAPSEMASSPAAPGTPAEPGDELSEARAQAERLARIIVSDIVLYNEEKFAAAIEAGTVAESLGPDLAEGRGLFRDRIDPRLQDEKDYLTEELLRVARTRGMQ